MTGLETILAFLVVMGVIAIPFAAVITRKSSAIGQALGDRIRRKTELREASGRLVRGQPEALAGPGANARNTRNAQTDQLAMLEHQQQEIKELSEKIDFIQRLIENQHDDAR